MNWSIAVQPALGAEALEEFRLQVREQSSAFDDELTRKLNAAVGYIQDVANRQLIDAIVVLTHKKFPHNNERLFLPPSPLLSVSSVQYVDGNNQSQTWNPSLYDVVTNEEPGFVEPAWNERYPDNARDVTVTYVSGYGTTWSSVDGSVIQTVLMKGEQLYRGTDWGELLTNQINHVMVGDDFHAYH